MKKAASVMKLAWQVFWPVFFIEVLSFALILPLYPAWDLHVITILTDLLAFVCLYPVYLHGIRERGDTGLGDAGLGDTGLKDTGLGDTRPADMGLADAVSKKQPLPVCRDAVFLAVFAAASCIVLNELILLLGIDRWSGSYQETSEALHSGGLWIRLLLMSAAAPLAEELIFRGICFERLKRHMSVPAACFFSALWFGVFHGNLVQGIYGFLMGLLLALVYEKYYNLRSSVWFHGWANLTSVLITEWTAHLPEQVPLLAVTAVIFLAAIVMGNCIRMVLKKE